MRCIELFAGCGGLALGLERAGARHALAVEVNKHAVETLKANTNWHLHVGDIREVDFKDYADIDIVSGGPPCQPFSVGGKHRAWNDPRNMFPEVVRAIDESKPKAFLLENVGGLVRERFRSYLGQIIAHLENAGAGYIVRHSVMNAADYGVPQVRRRVFIVGFRRDSHYVWSPPDPTHPKSNWITVGEALRDLPDPPSSDGASSFTDHRFQPNAKMYPGHTGSPLDKPAKALKAGVHGVPGGENMLRRADGTVRYFSIREAARLQTFPDNWCFKGSWTESMRQLGNAVPVRLAETVARSVVNAVV